ncbi:TPA: hypothetical protein ACH3X3_010342 [Trebouxia sp. C0006]
MSLDCLQVAAYVPESALYTQLQKYKRKTDAYLLQKQSEVQDALRRPHPVAKKLCLLCTTHMPTKRPLPHLQARHHLKVVAGSTTLVFMHQTVKIWHTYRPGPGGARGSQGVNAEPDDGNDVTSQPSVRNGSLSAGVVAAYVPESAPESALYTQLQRYERKTGACLLQKQSEVQDALCRLQLIVKKLRIYLHNTHAKTSLPHPQPYDSRRPWTAPNHPPPPSNSLCTTPPPTPFTHYIRCLTAELDSEQYSDGEEHVIWEKGQHVQNHEDL